LNKQDLPAKITIEQAVRLSPGRKVLKISALCGEGLKRLEQEIADYIWQGKSASGAEILVSNIRHREALKKAQRFLKRAIKAAEANRGAEIIALEIKEAQASLGEIIGKISCEDILDRIFSQFCIGK